MEVAQMAAEEPEDTFYENMAADWRKLAEARGELLTLVMQEDSANRAELAEWKKLAEAQRVILVAHRNKTRTPYKALDAVEAARDQLRKMGKHP